MFHSVDKFGEDSQRVGFIAVYDPFSPSKTKTIFFNKTEETLLNTGNVIVFFGGCVACKLYVKLPVRDWKNVCGILRAAGPTINGVNYLIRYHNASLIALTDVSADEVIDFSSMSNVTLYKGSRNVYRGTLSQFDDYLNDNNNLSGKVVKFRYRSGSKPGAVRVVKVEKFDGYYLEGTDASKGEYRKYTVGQMVGGKSGIEILA